MISTFGVLISDALAGNVEGAAVCAEVFAIVLVVAGITYLALGGLLLLRLRRRRGRR